MKIKVRDLTIVKEIKIAGGIMSINRDKGDRIIIRRFAERGKVNNFVTCYEKISNDGSSELIPFDMEIAETVLERIQKGIPYSSVYMFYDGDYCDEIDLEKTDMEHKYTSTGVKFWRHQEQMLAFKHDKPNSIVSTHISPEGSCNLKCPYCSVTYRDTHSRIDLDVIKKYVTDLQTIGLKAVILTGGGEPTSYKYFNELVQWIKYDRGLSVALITNGTLTKRIKPKTWKAFSWIRVSINIFDGWETKINLPTEHLSEDCIVGASMVYTSEHENVTDEDMDRNVMFGKVAKIADRINAKYVRVLPNCLLEQRDLFAMHKSLDKVLENFNDERFFHQHKIHGKPKNSTCSQAYFRPYLSEEIHKETGKPGAVYPCDSVVLNDSFAFFASQYQICHASDILKFFNREIKMKFNATKRCDGCVFTDSVNMLHDWKTGKIDEFDKYQEPLNHEEFV
jgi:organic radical activating enzyme